MIAVIDASPFIILAKAQLHPLLFDIFEEVRIPRAVCEEIQAGPVDDPARHVLAKDFRFLPVVLDPPMSPVAGWSLGQGESEVLEWACRNPGTVAILDDLGARRAARTLGVPITGTLGLLAAARERNLIQDFIQTVRGLEKLGFYADQRLISQVAKNLSE